MTATDSFLSVTPQPPRRVLVKRHSLAVRLTHWINVLCLSFLLMSGLQIFNAHPELYWGQFGADADHAFLALEAVDDNGALKGVTRIGSVEIPTTGVLGASVINGELRPRGFPTWITIPSYRDLAAGRRWHFFFAWLFVINGFVYLVYGFVAGHFRRDLAPRAGELTPRHLAHEIVAHARLRFPKGEAARRYNVLQKLAYLAVALVLLPLMVATGLTMSPGIDAALPWLVDIFGGRQSARSIHFITASLLVLFVIVHLAMVLLSGVFNNLRSMITGRYAIETELPPEAEERRS
ncbi:MAG TPA: cytochrome b/b6 domain-containing protein [Kaistia sp.]|nr:cytochrome b/b6 domain-containing protein [Kaistia sp.]